MRSVLLIIITIIIIFGASSFPSPLSVCARASAAKCIVAESSPIRVGGFRLLLLFSLIFINFVFLADSTLNNSCDFFVFFVLILPLVVLHLPVLFPPRCSSRSEEQPNNPVAAVAWKKKRAVGDTWQKQKQTTQERCKTRCKKEKVQKKKATALCLRLEGNAEHLLEEREREKGEITFSWTEISSSSSPVMSTELLYIPSQPATPELMALSAASPINNSLTAHHHSSTLSTNSANNRNSSTTKKGGGGATMPDSTASDSTISDGTVHHPSSGHPRRHMMERWPVAQGAFSPPSVNATTTLPAGDSQSPTNTTEEQQQALQDSSPGVALGPLSELPAPLPGGTHKKKARTERGGAANMKQARLSGASPPPPPAPPGTHKASAAKAKERQPSPAAEEVEGGVTDRRRRTPSPASSPQSRFSTSPIQMQPLQLQLSVPQLSKRELMERERERLRLKRQHKFQPDRLTPNSISVAQADMATVGGGGAGLTQTRPEVAGKGSTAPAGGRSVSPSTTPPLRPTSPLSASPPPLSFKQAAANLLLAQRNVARKNLEGSSTASLSIPSGSPEQRLARSGSSGGAKKETTTDENGVQFRANNFCSPSPMKLLDSTGSGGLPLTPSHGSKVPDGFSRANSGGQAESVVGAGSPHARAKDGRASVSHHSTVIAHASPSPRRESVQKYPTLLLDMEKEKHSAVANLSPRLVDIICQSAILVPSPQEQQQEREERQRQMLQQQYEEHLKRQQELLQQSNVDSSVSGPFATSGSSSAPCNAVSRGPQMDAVVRGRSESLGRHPSPPASPRIMTQSKFLEMITTSVPVAELESSALWKKEQLLEMERRASRAQQPYLFPQPSMPGSQRLLRNGVEEVSDASRVPSRSGMNYSHSRKSMVQQQPRQNVPTYMGGGPHRLGVGRNGSYEPVNDGDSNSAGSRATNNAGGKVISPLQFHPLEEEHKGSSEGQQRPYPMNGSDTLSQSQQQQQQQRQQQRQQSQGKKGRAGGKTGGVQVKHRGGHNAGGVAEPAGRACPTGLTMKRGKSRSTSPTTKGKASSTTTAPPQSTLIKGGKFATSTSSSKYLSVTNTNAVINNNNNIYGGTTTSDEVDVDPQENGAFKQLSEARTQQSHATKPPARGNGDGDESMEGSPLEGTATQPLPGMRTSDTSMLTVNTGVIAAASLVLHQEESNITFTGTPLIGIGSQNPNQSLQNGVLSCMHSGSPPQSEPSAGPGSSADHTSSINPNVNMSRSSSAQRAGSAPPVGNSNNLDSINVNHPERLEMQLQKGREKKLRKQGVSSPNMATTGTLAMKNRVYSGDVGNLDDIPHSPPRHASGMAERSTGSFGNSSVGSNPALRPMQQQLLVMAGSPVSPDANQALEGATHSPLLHLFPQPSSGSSGSPSGSPGGYRGMPRQNSPPAYSALSPTGADNPFHCPMVIGDNHRSLHNVSGCSSVVSGFHHPMSYASHSTVAVSLNGGHSVSAYPHPSLNYLQRANKARSKERNRESGRSSVGLAVSSTSVSTTTSRELVREDAIIQEMEALNLHTTPPEMHTLLNLHKRTPEAGLGLATKKKRKMYIYRLRCSEEIIHRANQSVSTHTCVGAAADDILSLSASSESIRNFSTDAHQWDIYSIHIYLNMRMNYPFFLVLSPFDGFLNTFFPFFVLHSLLFSLGGGGGLKCIPLSFVCFLQCVDAPDPPNNYFFRARTMD
eukprot:gene1630-999_t